MKKKYTALYSCRFHTFSPKIAILLLSLASDLSHVSHCKYPSSRSNHCLSRQKSYSFALIFHCFLPPPIQDQNLHLRSFPIFQKWFSLIIPSCLYACSPPFLGIDLSVFRHVGGSPFVKHTQTVLTLCPAYPQSVFPQHTDHLAEPCPPTLCLLCHRVSISVSSNLDLAYIT